jgi:hypothetical protein
VKPSSTVQLRLRGVTPMHALVAAISSAPLAFVLVQVARGLPIAQVTLLAVGAVVAAALPWLSWAAARASYRAKVDDVAVHVRGEAMPWRTITAVTVEKTPRRTLLRLTRGETSEIVLVLADAFAGRLEPRDALAAHLAEHGWLLEDDHVRRRGDGDGDGNGGAATEGGVSV